MSTGLSGLRILVVEDNRWILQAMGNIVGAFGHPVTAAPGVVEALGRVQEGAFDRLISDLNMTDGSGLELIHEIRMRGDLPAIAMSGDTAMREQSLAGGFSAFLAKPFRSQALLLAIGRVLNGFPPDEISPGYALQV